jgi:hypothetical protein
LGRKNSCEELLQITQVTDSFTFSFATATTTNLGGGGSQIMLILTNSATHACVTRTQWNVVAQAPVSQLPFALRVCTLCRVNKTAVESSRQRHRHRHGHAEERRGEERRGDERRGDETSPCRRASMHFCSHELGDEE